MKSRCKHDNSRSRTKKDKTLIFIKENMGKGINLLLKILQRLIFRRNQSARWEMCMYKDRRSCWKCMYGIVHSLPLPHPKYMMIQSSVYSLQPPNITGKRLEAFSGEKVSGGLFCREKNSTFCIFVLSKQLDRHSDEPKTKG